jgi:hypothetical protein
MKCSVWVSWAARRSSIYRGERGRSAGLQVGPASPTLWPNGLSISLSVLCFVVKWSLMSFGASLVDLAGGEWKWKIWWWIMEGEWRWRWWWWAPHVCGSQWLYSYYNKVWICNTEITFMKLWKIKRMNDGIFIFFCLHSKFFLWGFLRFIKIIYMGLRFLLCHDKNFHFIFF